MTDRPTADEVLAVVQGAVATVLELDPASVTRETRFREDLDGLTSVGDAVDYAVARL